MQVRRQAMVLVVTVVTAACADAPRHAASGRHPVPEILRKELTGITEPAVWTVGSAAEWRAIWQRIPAGERQGQALLSVDFQRDVMIVVAAGWGSSGAPELSFEGYATHRDTTDVFVRHRMPAPGCSAADDVTQLVVAGRIPRRRGPVRVIERRVLTC